MKPGRELDALVAEKVIGLKRRGNLFYPNALAFIAQPAHEYSTDIAAAWEVVDKLHSVGQVMVMESYGPNQYEVGFGNGDTEYSNVVVGESAPHAICLAALKALKHER